MISEDACHLKLLSEYTSASGLPVTSLLFALKMFSPSLHAMNIVAAYSKCHCLSQAQPWSYHAIHLTSFASSDFKWIRPFVAEKIVQKRPKGQPRKLIKT